MAERTIKIVLTGAESTGKSQLSEALANHYRAVWIPEFARSYIENLDHHYTYEDVEEIARMQVQEELNISPTAPLVFLDTWLIITKVWFEFVFGKSPAWLDQHIAQCSIDLFLLCDTDIPWEPDPVRENGGETREILQNRYIKELESYGFNYMKVTGNGKIRFQNALTIVDQFLNSKATNKKQ